MYLKNSKPEWKHIKNPRTVLTHSRKNAIKRFGKNEWMFRIVIKTWKCEKSSKKAVLKGRFAICEVRNNLINLKNNKGISSRELKLQLSNVIKTCTERLT